MTRTLLALALAGTASLAVAAGIPPSIAAAVADPARPAADTARDAARKPAELLAFFGVAPGQKVAEMLPGGGYFTRILSRAVGPRGRVYVLGRAGAVVTVAGVTGAPGYANVRAVTPSADSLDLPEQVDIVWTSLNYHDLKNPPRGGGAPVDLAALNRAVYRALKPGGHYVVIDHSARPGDAAAPAALHRIDQRTVVDEIAAAGFLKQSETQALRRPDDPRTANPGTLAGASDQFAMLFRKPDLSMGGAIRDRQEVQAR